MGFLVSWSPKGKQIAVGLQGGDIITFSPTETDKLKLAFGRPPCANGLSVIGITWLSNPTLHTIYAPTGPLNPDAEQTHIIMSLDAKKNTASDIRLVTPYFPSPAIRPPGSFVIVLRNWEPVKVLLFAGDSSSSDIGVIGAIGEDSWYNFSLEETSTPSLPLDKDMNDTVLVSLDMDLTLNETYHYTGPSGEESQLPPPPIMYAYASDGTILGWFVVNSQGASYPGMASVTTSMQNIVAPSMSSAVSQNDMQMTSAPITPIAAPAGPFGQPQPIVGQSPFGPPQPSTSTFSQPASTSSGFGQTLSGSGQPSTFGQATTVSSFNQGFSAFGTTNRPGGFAAFASSGPARFGPSAFGAASSSPASLSNLNLTPLPDGPAEDSMASDEPAPFGGLFLGSSSESKPVNAFGSGSTFGQGARLESDRKPASNTFSTSGVGSSQLAPGFGAFANLNSQSSALGNAGSGEPPFTSHTPKPGSASSSIGFGSSKPAPGFGAFSNLSSQPSSFGNTIPKESRFTSDTPKPASALGQSGFEAHQSTFGQPSFSQPVFGKPGFGFTVVPASQPSVGGFGAYASSGPSSFTSATLSKDTASSDSPKSTLGIRSKTGQSVFSISQVNDNNVVSSASGTQRSIRESPPRNSSFVEVTAPQEDEEATSSQETMERPEELASDVEDDTQSFLSESFSDGDNPDDGSDDDDDDEQPDRQTSHSPSPETAETAETVLNTIPSTTPQPQSRSPSTTPKPTLSSLNLSSSSSPSPSPPLSSKAGDGKLPANTTEAGSTTPPGSPPLDSSKSPLPRAPVPVPAVASTSPFGLGLGRPSTRPTRSSPLANAPLSPDEEVEPQAETGTLQTSKLALPKPTFGQWGSDTKTVASTPESQSSVPQPKRPKTPPLLSVGVIPSKPTSSIMPSRFSLLPSSSVLSQGRLDAKALPSGGSTYISSQPSSLFGAKLNNVSSTTPFKQEVGLANSLTPSSRSPFATNPSTSGSNIRSAPAAKATAVPSAAFGSPSLNQDNRGAPFIGSQVPKIPLSDPQAKGMQAECQKLCEYINTELVMVSDRCACLALDLL